jgi:hypothetical protein
MKNWLDLAVRLTGFKEQFMDWQKKAIANFHITTDTDETDTDWVKENFPRSRSWAKEFKAAGTGRAISITMTGPSEVTGFVCWNTTKLGYFGPLGVAEKFRGNDIGTGLTLFALWKMEEAGYGWAIIHRVGPVEFYKKFLSIVELPRY